MEQGRTFDSVAALYDAHRSGYADALFADIATIAELGPKARALEIGCGSGQATAGFAARGYAVTALEPGPALLDIARERFAAVPNVAFVATTFEDWPAPPAHFHLVAAAQSWHWLRPDLRFGKAAESLAPGGSLALFGHTPRWSSEVIGRLEPAYRSLEPALWAPPPETWYLPEGPIPALIAASGRFEAVAHRRYDWRRRYAARAFADYLGTRSDHLRLPTERREAMLARIAASLPPEVEADWVTNLYVARVR